MPRPSTLFIVVPAVILSALVVYFYVGLPIYTMTRSTGRFVVAMPLPNPSAGPLLSSAAQNAGVHAWSHNQELWLGEFDGKSHCEQFLRSLNRALAGGAYCRPVANQ
jgi:hypothetical protein